MTTDKDISYGYCHCGCGGKTRIIIKSNKTRNLIKGEPYKFIHGHHLKLAVSSGNPLNKPKYIITNGWRKYCNIYYVKCNYCNKVFIARRSNEKFCFIKCRNNYINHKSISSLSFRYISNLLRAKTSLQPKDIPIELIMIKVKLLRLKRLLHKTKLKGEQYVERIGNSGSSINSNQGT